MLNKMLAFFFTITFTYSYGLQSQGVSDNGDHLPFSLVEFRTVPSLIAPQSVKIHNRWKLGIVPYLMDVFKFDYILQNRIRDVIKIIERESCLRFQALTSPPDNGTYYLNITTPVKLENRGCVHELDDGDNGVTYVRIGYDCLKKTQLLHVMMHAAGMKDEVNHPQRDKYIRIMWENIKPEHRSKFHIHRDIGVQGQYEYDPSSITHFHDRAFTRNGQATIVPMMAGLQIRPSGEISLLDKQKLQGMYANECNKRKVSKLTHSCKHIMKGLIPKSPCAPAKLSGKLPLPWDEIIANMSWANITGKLPWTGKNNTWWANITNSKKNKHNPRDFVYNSSNAEIQAEIWANMTANDKYFKYVSNPFRPINVSYQSYNPKDSSNKKLGMYMVNTNPNITRPNKTHFYGKAKITVTSGESGNPTMLTKKNRHWSNVSFVDIKASQNLVVGNSRRKNRSPQNIRRNERRH